jgi:hypothetical protein
MADCRIYFTLGSHTRFGSLDFICMGVDYDLVLLPPSVPDDSASSSSSTDNVSDLDSDGTEEGECVLPPLAGSFDPPTDIDSITESMAGSSLHANEARASGGAQPHVFDYPRRER